MATQRPAGNSVAFFTPFGGPGLAGAEGPCEISRLDDDFRRGSWQHGDGIDRITLYHDWPIFAAAAVRRLREMTLIV